MAIKRALAPSPTAGGWSCVKPRRDWAARFWSVNVSTTSLRSGASKRVCAVNPRRQEVESEPGRLSATEKKPRRLGLWWGLCQRRPRRPGSCPPPTPCSLSLKALGPGFPKGPALTRLSRGSHHVAMKIVLGCCPPNWDSTLPLGDWLRANCGCLSSRAESILACRPTSRAIRLQLKIVAPLARPFCRVSNRSRRVPVMCSVTLPSRVAARGSGRRSPENGPNQAEITPP
jgi:hypothetical protein